MMIAPSLDELLKIDYEIIIRRKKDNKYIAGIEDLGIFANHTNISGAIDLLEGKKRDLFKDLIENEAVDSLPEPTQGRRGREHGGGGAFTVRSALLIAAIFFGGLLVLGGLATMAISPVVDRISEEARGVVSKADPGNIIRKVAPALKYFTTQMKFVSSEKREEVLGDLRETIRVLQPFANEFRPLFCPTTRATNEKP